MIKKLPAISAAFTGSEIQKDWLDRLTVLTPFPTPRPKIERDNNAFSMDGWMEKFGCCQQSINHSFLCSPIFFSSRFPLPKNSSTFGGKPLLTRSLDSPHKKNIVEKTFWASFLLFLPLCKPLLFFALGNTCCQIIRYNRRRYAGWAAQSCSSRRYLLTRYTYCKLSWELSFFLSFFLILLSPASRMPLIFFVFFFSPMRQCVVEYIPLLASIYLYVGDARSKLSFCEHIYIASLLTERVSLWWPWNVLTTHARRSACSICDHSKHFPIWYNFSACSKNITFLLPLLLKIERN